MEKNSVAHLSDHELLDQTAQAAVTERRATADLIALLAEVDLRKLYLGEGYSSLFSYCTQVLRLSESAAYRRITAARLSRRLPAVLGLLAAGKINLSTVSLLAGHLTDENADQLLTASSHKGKREVEQLVASLQLQPDVPSILRRLPVPSRPEADLPSMSFNQTEAAEEVTSTVMSPAVSALQRSDAPRRSIVAPIAADRFVLRITLSAQTHRKLTQARDLLRHTIPSGDPAIIVDRALTVLLNELARTRLAATSRPRTWIGPSKGRHVPASVRRAVWARDQGRCAFVGSRGRCEETGFLELHHVIPFAAGGPTTAANLELRCRAHNAFEADVYFKGGVSAH